MFTPHARAVLDPGPLLLSGTKRIPGDVARFEQKWGKEIHDPCYSERFSRKKADYRF